MDGDTDDPYASITKLCLIPSPQEVILRNCPFFRQFEVFSEDIDGIGDDSSPMDGTPVTSTSIIMVSLPETVNDENTPHVDEFDTRPVEQHQVASSEVLNIGTVDHDGDETMPVVGDDETLAVDGGTEIERTVDLNTDSELGFLGETSMGRIDAVVLDKANWTSSENQLNRLKLSEDSFSFGECSKAMVEDEIEESPERIIRTVEESESKKVHKSTESIEKDEVMWFEGQGQVCLNDSAEVIEFEFEENRGVLGSAEATEKENSVMKEICEDSGHQNKIKNIEDIEKFRYVGDGNLRGRTSRGGNEMRRALPRSFCGEVENVERREKPMSGRDYLLEVLKFLGERCEPPKVEKVDILEIAKRHGMKFPQPSWWPPEGYGEE